MKILKNKNKRFFLSKIGEKIRINSIGIGAKFQSLRSPPPPTPPPPPQKKISKMKSLYYNPYQHNKVGGNATITHCRSTHDTDCKEVTQKLTAMQQQEHKVMQPALSSSAR